MLRAIFFVVFITLSLLVVPPSFAQPPLELCQMRLGKTPPPAGLGFWEKWRARAYRSEVEKQLLIAWNALGSKEDQARRWLRQAVDESTTWLSAEEKEEILIRMSWGARDSFDLQSLRNHFKSATPQTRDRLFAFLRAQGPELPPEARFLLNKLVDLCFRFGFSPEISKHLDNLSMASKKLLIIDPRLLDSGELSYLDGEERRLVRKRSFSFSFELLRQELWADLEKLPQESWDFSETTEQNGLIKFLEHDIALNRLRVGYHDFSIIDRLRFDETQDPTHFSSDIVQFLYRLSRHRLQNALLVRDRNGGNSQVAFLEPSAQAIVIVLDWISRQAQVPEAVLQDLVRWVGSLRDPVPYYLKGNYREIRSVLLSDTVSSMQNALSAPLVDWSARLYRFERVRNYSTGVYDPN